MLDKSKTYTYDSRKVNAGDSFICLPKGETFIEDALNRGANDVVHMSRKEFAENANDYFDYPTQKICLIGITGTNGKTSVSYFTAQLLEALGYKVLVIGTINSPLTTPESWDILNKIKQHVDQGGTHVVLEVSSHGIDQKRVFGFDFNVKCLTNITHDHLDYHKTFENYKNTKMEFMLDYPGLSIYSDDLMPVSQELIPQLIGGFHQKNVASALAICEGLNIERSKLHSLLPQLQAPMGRFQTLEFGQPFTVIIDFAHTPDALEKLLHDALDIANGNKDRLRVVFGCGGDRDVTKRPAMGSVAARFSHQIYLTADNSRSEAPLAIMDDIKKGIENTASIRQVLPDRHDAIALAINDANKHDVVVIAGKGHETKQVLNRLSYYFNDVDIASFEIFKQRKFRAQQHWILNQPDAKADVLFISKKLIPLLKITYSQFRRSLPTPSNSKIKDYLSKIQGEKIVFLESNSRHSMHQMFTFICGHSSRFVSYEFDPNQSLEHNLVGLTLIDQTQAPLMIKIDPSTVSNLSRVIDVVSPQHIIVGDLFTNEYVELSIQKTILKLLADNNPKFSLWCSHLMSDLSEPLDELNQSQVHIVKTSTWFDYLLEVAKELLIKLEVYHDDPTALFQQYLFASQLYYKCYLGANNRSLYVVRWLDDKIDLKFKLAFFKQNSDFIHHFILPDDAEQSFRTTLSQVIEVDDTQRLFESSESFFEQVESDLNGTTLQLVWMMPSQSLSELEALI